MGILVIPAALLILVLAGLQFDTVQSECCSTAEYWGSDCADGSPRTPCCGNGPCNLLCCNCYGGCRRRLAKREVNGEVYRSESRESSQGGSEEENDPFSKYDSDGDGKISLPEARNWLMGGGCGDPTVKVMALNSEFLNMDSDNDGLLDRDEIGG